MGKWYTDDRHDSRNLIRELGFEFLAALAKFRFLGAYNYGNYWFPIITCLPYIFSMFLLSDLHETNSRHSSHEMLATRILQVKRSKVKITWAIQSFVNQSWHRYNPLADDVLCTISWSKVNVPHIVNFCHVRSVAFCLFDGPWRLSGATAIRSLDLLFIS